MWCTYWWPFMLIHIRMRHLYTIKNFNPSEINERYQNVWNILLKYIFTQLTNINLKGFSNPLCLNVLCVTSWCIFKIQLHSLLFLPEKRQLREAKEIKTSCEIITSQNICLGIATGTSSPLSTASIDDQNFSCISCKLVGLDIFHNFTGACVNERA